MTRARAVSHACTRTFARPAHLYAPACALRCPFRNPSWPRAIQRPARQRAVEIARYCSADTRLRLLTGLETARDSREHLRGNIGSISSDASSLHRSRSSRHALGIALFAEPSWKSGQAAKRGPAITESFSHACVAVFLGAVGISHPWVERSERLAFPPSVGGNETSKTRIAVVAGAREKMVACTRTAAQTEQRAPGRRSRTGNAMREQAP